MLKTSEHGHVDDGRNSDSGSVVVSVMLGAMRIIMRAVARVSG